MKTGIISGETVILKSLSRELQKYMGKESKKSSVQFGWSEEGVKKNNNKIRNVGFYVFIKGI